MRKVTAYADFVEVVYVSGGDDRIYSTQNRLSSAYSGPAIAGTFSMGLEDTNHLDGMKEFAEESFTVDRIEITAPGFAMTPYWTYDNLVTMWNVDQNAEVNRIEGNLAGEVAGTGRKMDPRTIQLALHGLAGFLKVDWYTAAFSEFGVTGADAIPIGSKAQTTNTAYATVISGPTTLSGTIFQRLGQYPRWVPDQQPASVTFSVPLEPFMSSVLPAVYADHRSRTNPTPADESTFAMRVSADPDDPLYGVVLDYTGMFDARYRYTFDGQLIGPVE